MATSFHDWAASRNACHNGLEYLAGKRLTWATWIQSSGEWRAWVCAYLNVEPSTADIQTSRCTCNFCRVDMVPLRERLNQPGTYAALRQHFERVVKPALRAQGVR